MKQAKFIFAFFGVFATIGILISPNLFGQSQPEWTAPSTTGNLKNPLHNDANVILEGGKLFKQFCAVCHGDKGKGDGIAGLSLKPKPANFTTAKIQQQSDGALFWKLTEGRAPMAAYKQILSENQRWQLVSYIRTFKK